MTAPTPPPEDPGVTRIERPAWDRGAPEMGEGSRASWEPSRPYGFEWQTFEWSSRRHVPILGIFLLGLGVALLVDQLTPISLSAIFLGVVAGLFAAAWIVWRARWAVTPTILLTALFVPDLLGDLGVLRGDGWTSIALALAFGLIWLIGRAEGRWRRWPMLLAVFFALLGVTQLSDQVPWLPDLDVFWPILFIAVGIVIVLDARHRPSSR
jgi:hypothetical protein